MTGQSPRDRPWALAGQPWPSGALGPVEEGAVVGTVERAVSQPQLTDPCAVLGPRQDVGEARERGEYNPDLDTAHAL